MTIKISHLLEISAWKDYAAGKINNVYPVPVEPNDIKDLVLFENNPEKLNKFSHVGITLSNSYNSGYMGNNMKYQKAKVGHVDEDKFSQSFNVININADKFKIEFNERYSTNIFEDCEGTTLSNLYIDMLRKGCKGTLTLAFTGNNNNKIIYLIL